VHAGLGCQRALAPTHGARLLIGEQLLLRAAEGIEALESAAAVSDVLTCIEPPASRFAGAALDVPAIRVPVAVVVNAIGA